MRIITIFLVAFLDATALCLPTFNDTGISITTNVTFIKRLSVGQVKLQKSSNAQDVNTYGITGYVFNACPFPVYLTTAYCCHDCFSPTVILLPGKDTTTMNITRAINNNCGQTIKLSRIPSFTGDIYQIEYNVDGGTVWYNLSAIDGDPFWRFQRCLEVRGVECEKIICPAGEKESNCNWPTMGDCPARVGNDVSFYLC